MIETAFTPLASLAGGVLIGLSAVLLMLTSGRIMGATGILSGALFGPGARDWRLALLAGMVSGPLAVMLLTGSFPVIQVPVTTAAMVVGGLLVGIGVSFGVSGRCQLWDAIHRRCCRC